MEGGQSGGLSRGDQLLGRPNDVCGGLGKEVRPVSGFGPFDGFEIAELGLPCCGVRVGGPEAFSPAGGFCEFLSEGGEEWGPPSLRLRGGAQSGCVFRNCRGECRGGRGELFVELVGGWAVGGGRN